MKRIAYVSEMCKTTDQCAPGKCPYFHVRNGNYFCTKQGIK